MHFTTALALVAAAPMAFADIRDEFQAGLRQSVEDAIAADHPSALGKTSEELAAIAKDASFILGIGDPEDYKPYKVDCPSDSGTWVRPATEGINKDETAYLEKRKTIIDNAVSKMLTANNFPSAPRTPKVGIALSGGGYRAMINGLGMTQALMTGSDEAVKAGTGGWFDGLSYMAGLSGGSWATGSFVVNNGMLPTDLIANIWNLDENLIYPSDGKVAFYTNMLGNVKGKRNEGFDTQITDYWALALGEHLLPEQYRMKNGANFSISQIPSTVSAFQNYTLPFPIIISAEREPNETIVPANTTVWEFTPYEFGSWAVGYNNLTEGYFTPIEYLGTTLVDGKPNGTCYKGFDQLSFVMGTSSTLFNYGIVELAKSNDSGLLLSWAQDVLSDISADKNDVSQIPNPGYKYNYQRNNESNPLYNLDTLTLIDAGETNQNIPLEPLLLRDLDAILAFDNSADTTYSWPNGSAIATTYQRAVAFKEQYHIDMEIAEIPSVNTFVNRGLNQRPVFFGCNVTAGPLIVYVPHYPWTWYSNSTTYTLQYDTSDATEQMLSAMRSLTLNGTVPTWPKCLSCAMTDRANGYTAANRTAECTECFNTWCWDGVKDDSEPASEYAPVMGVTPEFLTKNNLSSDVRTDGADHKKSDHKNAASPLHAAAGATVAALALSLLML